MNRDLKWMLLGIFLGVAATWCMLFATNGASILPVLGSYALPIIAVICFATGFTGVEGKPPPAESSHVEHQTEESDKP